MKVWAKNILLASGTRVYLEVITVILKRYSKDLKKYPDGLVIVEIDGKPIGQIEFTDLNYLELKMKRRLRDIGCKNY